MSVKFLIPDIGTRFELAEDWTFNLYGESRNEAVLKYLQVAGFEDWWKQRDQCWPVTLPAGTCLSVDRVYIRRGASDFSSLTFNLLGVKGKGRLRFWAKLDDVNKIVINDKWSVLT